MDRENQELDTVEINLQKGDVAQGRNYDPDAPKDQGAYPMATDSIRNVLRGIEKEMEGIDDERVRCIKEKIHALIATENKEKIETFCWPQQFTEANATLRQFGLTGEAMPTLADVLHAFSPEQHRAIKELKEPTLLLVPNISFAGKIRTLEESGFIHNIYVKEYQLPMSGERKEQITAWRPVIIEGMQKMERASYDNLDHTLQFRIVTTRKNHKLHVNGTDRDQYAMLVMHSLITGRPIDLESCTILDGEVLKGNRIPVGSLQQIGNILTLTYDWDCAGSVYLVPRFRSTVIGNEIRA